MSMRRVAVLAGACCARAAALRLTRRALAPAALAPLASRARPAWADGFLAEDVVQLSPEQIAENAAKKAAAEAPKRVRYGRGSVEMPGNWIINGETISETILGTITSSVRSQSAATAAQSIDQFGVIDKLDLTKLGLLGNRGIGDVVKAKKRLDGDHLFYEWDLAVPPTNGCPRSEQELIVCPPVEVALVAATVADGNLVVWECGVDQRQWKSYGKSLRAVRSSFRLGD
jgi:hypothetical protein